MKKLLLIILVLMTFTIGCKDSKVTGSFSLAEENLEININDFAQLPIELTNLKINDLTFQFSVEDIIFLDNDLLIPLNAGETVLTITYKTTQKALNIKVNYDLPNISLSGKYLEVGTTSRVDITNFENNEFDWAIGNENIIKLTNNDKVYSLTALKIGVTTLTVTSKTNPLINNTISVEVREVTPILKAPLQLLNVGDVTQMMITNQTNKELTDYTWEVSDESILHLDENYQVTALKVGIAVITVTSKVNNLVQATFEITIATPSTETNAKGEPSKGPLFLIPGNTAATVKAGEAIEVKVLGSVSNYNYRWRALDPTVVAATDMGVIMGFKEGRTTLTVWSKDDETVRGKIEITVTGTPNVNYAKRIVNAGLLQEGYAAGPNKNNKFGDWFMYNNVDWCAIFVSWCVNTAGIGIDVIPKFSLVSDGVRWFQQRDQYEAQGGDYQPKAGDIIFFQSEGTPSHVGIVTGSDSEKVYTIEGNTSSAVHQRSYLLTNTYILGYGLPAYPPFTE